ncbi:galactokinase gal [Artomyces pyxidatus]|uniref:Galactokinase gal n=1 Tax=Artomyces pyxidatus TaxID=48021 RepID=A0ACB8SR88_9AGAM|nr:galactokinase gal [Artomyces pyxidatus]
MAAQLPIPVYSSSDELYKDLGTATDHATRWTNLAEEFEKRFGRKPSYIARAPGRVNLIGEHIDYALFGVLPAAIERDVLIACAPRDPLAHPRGSVNAHNLHYKYPPRSFSPVKKRSQAGSTPDEEPGEDAVHVEEWHLEIDKKELRWESYVKAGYYGVLNHSFPTASATSPDEPDSHPLPVDLLVTGTVPAGSGLSSSAAMVVSSTLVFLAVNDKLEGVSKGTLVEMSMENEQRVGVNSGGMDQAASVISTPSAALYVTFYPRLAATPVSLPGKSASFVLANSLVTSEKAVHARTRYNLRVVETLVAARVLSLRLGVDVGARERITLRQVVGRVANEPEGGWQEDDRGLRSALERMVKEVALLRPPTADADGQEGVSLEEMIKWSGLPEKEFHDVYLSWIDVEAEHFQLYKRAKHVFSEALRVLEFRDICLKASSADVSTNDVLKKLGGLMDASMESCSKDFDCACPELDQLTQLARDAGAYGSRLTGAGWGGCTVSLVAEDQVEIFITKLKTTYPPYKDLEGDTLEEVIFATKPSSGACGA